MLISQSNPLRVVFRGDLASPNAVVLGKMEIFHLIASFSVSGLHVNWSSVRLYHFDCMSNQTLIESIADNQNVPISPSVKYSVVLRFFYTPDFAVRFVRCVLV